MEHLTEGTKEWDELAHYLLASGNSDPAFDAVARNYFKCDETVGESALAKFRAEGGKFADLNEQEQLFLTELIAHETEVLFGSERMLKRIAKEKRSLAKRLLERIEDFFRLLKMSKEERKAFVKLEQARACLEKALLAAGDAEGEKRKKDSISIDNYTEEQYNNFGWVRANDVISAGQYADFSTKFAGAVSGQLHFNKSKFDEYMIPVSDLYRRDLEGIENVIVFAKGEIECPYITRITEINSYNYKEIEEIQEVVYESGKRGIQITDSELLRLYYNPNAGSAENVAFGEGFDGNENSSGKRVGRRSGKTDKRVVGFRELEEGVTEYQYSDGTAEIISDKNIRKSKADAEFESFSAEDFFHEAATRSVSEVVGESEKSTNAPEAPQVPKKRGLSEGQAKKLEANYVNHKTFSRKEVAEVVDSITRKHLDFGEDYGVLIGKGRQEAAKRFFA